MGSSSPSVQQEWGPPALQLQELQELLELSGPLLLTPNLMKKDGWSGARTPHGKWGLQQGMLLKVHGTQQLIQQLQQGRVVQLLITAVRQLLEHGKEPNGWEALH